MDELVLLKYDIASRAVVVLCPQCTRISRQALKDPYSPLIKPDLIRPHICPVCKSTYRSCSLNGAENYSADLARYFNMPSQYEDAVRENYAKSHEPKSAPVNHNFSDHAPEKPQNLSSILNNLLQLQKSINTSELFSDTRKAQSTIPVPHTKISNWKDLFSTDILQRGRTIYNAGCVKSLIKKDNCYSAVVSCAEEHNVIISYDRDKIASMTCDCIPAQSGELCDHMAAVMYDSFSEGTDMDTLKSVENQESKLSLMASTDSPTQQNSSEFFSIPDMQSPALNSNDVVAYNQELDRKIESWKRELLDTGKRNKMINYRETKRATLKILEPSAEELFNQLAISEKTLTFQKPISKETDIRTYSFISLLETLSYSFPVTKGDIKTGGTIVEREKTLKNLRSKAKLALEEQGANILYLCFGFIYWRANDRSNSPWVKSPLLMMPVTLGLKSLNAPYTLAKGDDEIEVNPTLDYLFNNEYNIDLPTFELKNKNSFSEYLHTIEEIVDRRGWKVVPEVSLGLLSFLKISMYHDLNDNRDLMLANPVLRAMAGDRTAIPDIPQAAMNYDFDKAEPAKWHEVVNSDSSQEEAILLSKMGVSFVMQGPPGTGKSQTITNIIAEALADGKKILFVSEKAAALQVVLKRLTEVGLSDFCLSLHNYKANKKEIIDSIGSNLSLQREYVGDNVLRELTELFRDRQYLNTYADELHTDIAPLGDSIYDAFGKLSQLESATLVSFSLDNPMEITKEQYASFLYCVSAFETALQNMDGPLSKNPWYGTNTTTSGQTYKEEFISATGALSSELREMDRLATEFNEKFHTSFDHSWNSIETGYSELEQAIALPVFTTGWLDSDVRRHMLSVAKYEQQEQQKYIAQCENFTSVLDFSVLSAPIETWIAKAESAKAGLSHLGYSSDFSMAPFSTAIANKDTVTALIGSLRAFVDQYRTAEDTAGIGGEITFANAALLYSVISLLAKNHQYIQPSWFDSDVSDRLNSHLLEAKAHAISLKNEKNLIAEQWKDSVYDIDASKISEYFDSDYSGIYHQMGDIGDIIGLEIENANTVLSTVRNLADSAKEAYSLLHYSGSDSFDDISMLYNVLSLIIEAPYMESDWFDPRKNSEFMPLIDEAVDVCASITEKTNALLSDWESSVLSIDVDGILSRFKTEYVGLFHKMKANYKEDIKTIRLNAKGIGTSIDEAQIVTLLQQIKSINEEKKWFEIHSSEMISVLGPRYKGIDTDWIAVTRSMQAALQITALFPYGSIPSETIQAILSIINSLQLTGEAKHIRENISPKKVELCSTEITSSQFISDFTHSAPLSEYVVPQIETFIRKSTDQLLYIDQFKRSKKTSTISYSEISDLLTSLILVEEHTKWFNDKSAVSDELFGSLNKGPQSDWAAIEAGINLANHVKALFVDRSVPNTVITYACSDDRDGNITFSIAMLAPDRIAEYQNTLTMVAPQWSSDQFSLLKIIDNLEAYLTITEDIASVVMDIHGYTTSVKVPTEELFTKLSTAKDARSSMNIIRERDQKNVSLFGERFTGINTDWKLLQQDIFSVERIITSHRIVATDVFLKMISCDLACRERLASSCLDLSKLISKTAPEIKYFDQQFDSEKFTDQNLLTVADHYEACLNGFGVLNKWLDYVETRAECDENGLADFTAKIAAADNTISDVRKAFEKGFYRQWVELAMDTMPSVRGFRRRVHEQRINRFITSDEKQYSLSQKRIRDKVIGTYPSTNRVARAGSELGILRHQMDLQRRHMPVRRLFESIPNLLLTLKPCLMMSPLSVAYFLNPESYQFDMVIFDEASQVFPQDAIGAIFRAKQVVIAGDTKQLPPTNFFASSTGNNDENFDNDEENYDEEVYDSILEETANILPNRTLLWHYRSKHEQLIAFSNQKIYKGELVTFPSSNESERDTGVEFVYVEDGFYEGGGKSCNILEARRIVELIKDHIDKHPDRSLGVIAFSEKQQNAISLEVQRFREKNPEYESFFVEGKEDEFFVKNLENVQGDERDTIIFSVGYAKTKEQKTNNRPMSMRFGPLGNKGGERRLNVAITRAKINVKLVSSILPSDIDLSRTKSEGVSMLRSYIEFAMNGETTLASERANAKPDDFVDSVAQYLTDHGYKVSKHIGCSGYKIDIAIAHPSDLVQQFAAGIECDGYSYASSRTVRDRDRLRGSVLKNMGWNMYRVWSAEWYKNPEIEGDKLVTFVKDAIKECDKKVKEIEEEKRKAEEILREAEEVKRKKQEQLMAEQEAAERKRKEESARLEAAMKAAREAKRRETPSHRAPLIQPSTEKAWKQWSEGIRHIDTEPKPKVSNVDVSWLTQGALAKHPSYGIGTVQQVDGEYVTIAFEDSEKRFIIPSAVENGHLLKPDTVVQSSNTVTSQKQSSKESTKNPSEMLRELISNGFTCIDNRSSSGIVWVLHRYEKTATFESILSGYNVQYKLERRGSIATHNAPAWRIMFN